MNRVWVSLLSSNSYFPGIRVLHYSLKKCKSKYPFVVAVTEEINPKHIKELHELGIQTILIPSEIEGAPVFPTSLHNFNAALLKIYVLNFTQFEAIGYLDADTAIQENIDYLFDRQAEDPETLLAAPACVCNRTKNKSIDDEYCPENCHLESNSFQYFADENDHLHSINSGVFICKPSRINYDRAIEMVRKTRNKYFESYADQYIITRVFIPKIRPLSISFNFTSKIIILHPILENNMHIKVFHFTQIKPWNMDIAQIKIARYPEIIWHELDRARIEHDSCCSKTTE